MEKMNLHKSTHIPLLKNDAQLKKIYTITQIDYKNKNYVLKKFGMRTKETLNKCTKAQQSKEKKSENKNHTDIKTRIFKLKTHTHITRTEAHVQLAHGHFCHSPIRIPTTQFSPHFEEKTF